MPMYYIVSMQFIWASNLLHRQYRYTHIITFSISIGELESYLSSLIGTMQRIPIKNIDFRHTFTWRWGHLLLASNEETQGKLPTLQIEGNCCSVGAHHTAKIKKSQR